jgi:carbonic anhydrase
MDKDEKMLFLIGMEQDLEPVIEQLNRKNAIILQSYQPVILQPFDDLMRDILVAVYMSNVKEIIVVTSTVHQQNTEELFTKIVDNKGVQELETLDYLFKNSIPEFHGGTIKDWLQGSRSPKESAKRTIDIIQQHPLMPSYVKVKELFIDREHDHCADFKAL